jgi:hypothetical protein
MCRRTNATGADGTDRAREKIDKQLLRGRRRRSHQRLFSTAMAGVAAHMPLAIRKLGIDVLRHADHHPGDVLLGIVIAGEIALHVAVATHHTQGSAKGLHGWLQTFSREHFEILGILERARSLLFLLLLGRSGQTHH